VHLLEEFAKKKTTAQPHSWSTKEDAETYSITELFNIQNRVFVTPKTRENSKNLSKYQTHVFLLY
jgi:hypothetical protein